MAKSLAVTFGNILFVFVGKISENFCYFLWLSNEVIANNIYKTK